MRTPLTPRMEDRFTTAMTRSNYAHNLDEKRLIKDNASVQPRSGTWTGRRACARAPYLDGRRSING